MIATILAFAAALSAVEAPEAPSPDDAGVATPAPPDNDQPKRRLRKGAAPEAPPGSQKVEPPDQAPAAEDDRPIPKPTNDEPPASDLDQLLQRQLGEDLDANEIEDADPIGRITQKMRRAEELLAQAREEQKSVEIQEQIVRELSQLLEDLQNQDQNSRQMQRMQLRKTPLNQRQLTQLRRQQAQARMQAARRSQRGEPAERPGPPAAARERLSPQPEDKAVWGHLSELLRAEMGQYAKDDFLAKYRDLIERYYTEIARQSRQRDGSPRPAAPTRP
jgi:hypothetical protein